MLVGSTVSLLLLQCCSTSGPGFDASPFLCAWSITWFLFLFFETRFWMHYHFCVIFTKPEEVLRREAIARLFGGCATDFSDAVHPLALGWIFIFTRRWCLAGDFFISGLEAACSFCNRVLRIDRKPSRCPVKHLILYCELYFV